MSMNERQDLLQELVGKRTVREWDLRWEPLPNAFTQSHEELGRVVGLFRVKLHGETKYIVAASYRKGGIRHGLRRISGPTQTGNRGSGAKMIRDHIDTVEVDILVVNDEDDTTNVIKRLKRLLVKYYDPVWAWPFKRYMAAIRAGTIKV
jgi:hypothetical protein